MVAVSLKKKNFFFFFFFFFFFIFFFFFFFFKQKTAYEILNGDWSSDVCSSDLKLSIIDLSFTEGPGGSKMESVLYELFSGDYDITQIGRASCRERV